MSCRVIGWILTVLAAIVFAVVAAIPQIAAWGGFIAGASFVLLLLGANAFFENS